MVWSNARGGGWWLRVLGIVLIGLAVLGPTLGQGTEARQRDESGFDGDTYTSPTYGFSLEWDGAVWSPNLPFEWVNSGFFAEDRMLLERVEGDEVLTSLWVSASAPGYDDLDLCIAGEVNLWLSKDTTLELDPLADPAIADDPETGGVSAAYAGVIVNQLDEEIDVVLHVECRWLGEDGTKLVLTTLTTPERYEDDLALVEDVTETTALDGAGSASRKAAQDEVEPDPKQYEGELYDFAITWDSNIWPNSSSYTWEGQEQIEITSGATTLTLHAYAAGDDDIEECVEAAQERREQADGIDNVEVADDLPLPIDQEGVEGVVLTYNLEVAGRDPLTMTEFVGCTQLEEAGSVLEISVLTRAGIYEEEVAIAAEVLDSLDLPLEEADCACINPEEEEGSEAA